ncbi:O-antigen polysaccharide polymerase Wzy [Aurantiacibacter spongiae]|nr:O-antigen polysaccharide polymerase Wzy [Aurantiacibacter spongiae]
MTYLLLFMSLLVGIAGLLQRFGYIKVPTLFGLVMGLWFSPQVILINEPLTLTQGSLNALAVTGLLCLGMTLAGWFLATRSSSKKPLAAPPDWQSLVAPLAILTVVMAVLWFSLAQLRTTLDANQQWTGPAVIITFFIQIRTITLALSLILVMRHRTPATIALALVNISICLPFLVVYLRRSALINLAIVTVGAMWFARRIVLSKPLILTGLMAAFVFVFSIAPLRDAQQRISQSTGETVSIFQEDLWNEIDFEESIRDSIGDGYDVRNAAYSVQLARDTGDYAYGGTLWNSFVSQYVARQIFGDNLKEDLQIKSGLLQTDNLQSRYSYFYKTGTTGTGVGTSFRDFGYFGSLIFGLIAFYLGRLFVRGSEGDIWAQVLYLALLPNLLTSITHGYDTFFVILPLFLLTIVFLRKLSGLLSGAGARHHNTVPRPRYRSRLSG